MLAVSCGEEETVDLSPIVTSISPDEGMPGTVVTTPQGSATTNFNVMPIPAPTIVGIAPLEAAVGDEPVTLFCNNKPLLWKEK